jgi:hypothetical protein
MVERFSDDYFINFAKNLLNDLFDYKLQDRKQIMGKDQPDLFSEIENIGIEVTQAITKLEGNIRHYFQLNNLDMQIINNIKNKEIRKLFKYSNEIISYSNNENNLELVYNAIKKKTKLLNEHYDIFSQNMLFIFASDCTNIEINLALSMFNKERKRFPKNFDKIFVLNTHSLVIESNNSIDVKNIDNFTIYMQQTMLELNII